jgi:hypothetical protein
MSDSNRYKPHEAKDRGKLAVSLHRMLVESGFDQKVDKKSRERVYGRMVHDMDNVEVLVYSTIRSNTMTVRSCAQDSIKVCAVYHGERGDKGLLSTKRINRTGHIAAIVQRTLETMRDVYGGVRQVDCCENCGAPKFKSKRGNLVCAAICWDDSATFEPAQDSLFRG